MLALSNFIYDVKRYMLRRYRSLSSSLGKAVHILVCLLHDNLLTRRYNSVTTSTHLSIDPSFHQTSSPMFFMYNSFILANKAYIFQSQNYSFSEEYGPTQKWFEWGDDQQNGIAQDHITDIWECRFAETCSSGWESNHSNMFQYSGTEGNLPIFNASRAKQLSD